MSGSAVSGQDIFDVRKIRRLIDLMKEHDLAELELQQGDVRVQLRRSGAETPVAMVAAPTPQPVIAAPPPSPTVEDQNAGMAVIKSPMVGTFYATPDPESPPFVKVGDHIGPETTVCIIEAMKVFNQIPAELSGRIVAVLAENGAPVEFGQPLFRIDTRE